MSAKRGMTLRAQWLGRQLRELREAAGLTLREAGTYIQRDGGTISRFEAGIYPARTPDVSALLDLYGVANPSHRAALMRLAADVWQEGWWDNYREELPNLIIDYAWLESRASRIRSFDAVVIPGLLQTPAYMEASMREVVGDDAPRAVGLQFRKERQNLLDRPEPPQLEAILDECLLCRETGGAAVLKDQLCHLVELSGRPNIDIRVLPFAAGAHSSPEGAFRIFDMSEPYPEAAYIDTPVGGLYVETEGVRRLILRYDCIRQRSLDPSQSIKLIEAAVDRLN
ncbi:helix-turn-helix transcriptional regulator [Thermopolyspora sp. NPDC052614]|uniref:helix-turn-helix domain-containing protein n=1 Tax=Thermopolyspora sp. NPDC052614 TaxID=3155682 RepID=UPI003436B5B8